MKYNQPYGVTDENAPYINGNPSTGQMGSIPPAASIEFPQREIVNVIEAANIEPPSNGALHQLASAIQSGHLNFAVDTGTANAYFVTLRPPPNYYYGGLEVVTYITHGNTGPSTLNVNALGNAPCIRYDGTPFTGGELKAGMIACFRFDGANWQHVWPNTYTAGGLVYLAAPRDYYVNDATGNDSVNDGLTPGTPFKTIPRAVEASKKFNLNGFDIRIHVADGTYIGDSVTLPPINGSGTIYLTGNPAAMSSVALQTAAGSSFIANGGPYVLDGFRVYAPLNNGGDPGSGVLTLAGGLVTVKAMAFDFCKEAHFEAAGSQISISGPINIIGGANSHLMPEQSGRIILNPLNKPVLNILNPINFLAAFCNSILLGLNYGSYQTITGYANGNGKKYSADMNGIISTGGAGDTYFPGTVAGTKSNGGQYS